MIITTGIKNAPVVPRLELRTFLQDKDVTNLYLLAIDKMQRIDQQDMSSWFQLAAIHGRPFVPYDNVGEKGNFGGYCTHSSILFPTWHRPYLALFEQSMAKHIVEIANDYRNPADKARYCAAAQRFRIPYWDWATEATLPDIVAVQENVVVHAPDGTRTQKNPLFSYKFNPMYSDFGDGAPNGLEKVWESWQSTVRYPSSEDDKGKSKPALMQAYLKKNCPALRDRTYNLLTQATDYAAFSNDGFLGPEGSAATFDSLESIHNAIHGIAGANGHMGEVDYAAYDPIFWMHHANVDRLFALWQVLNPNDWVVPKVTEKGTFTTPPNSTEDSKTNLTPFRRSETTFWNSDDVRDTRTFNYTYPELAKWSTLSADQKRIRIHSEINRIYGRSGPVAAAAPLVFEGLPEPPAGGASAPAKGPQTSRPGAAPAASDSPFEVADSKLSSDHWHENTSTADDKPHYHEWIANIAVEKYAANSSFFVHIFLGDFSTDPEQWGLDPNLVASHVIFANDATTTGCERCRDAHERHKLVTGTIPLTTSLGQRLGNVSELEPAQVVPYLQQNLHWRIQRHNGTVMDRADVPSLKVSVGHALVVIPQSSAEFASWGDIQIHSSVTTGRPGGASAA